VDWCIGVVLKEHQVCESTSNGYRLRCETGYVEVRVTQQNKLIISLWKSDAGAIDAYDSDVGRKEA